MSASLSRREILAGVAITGVAAAGGAFLGRRTDPPASSTGKPSRTSKGSGTPTGPPQPSPTDSTANPPTQAPSGDVAVRAYEAEAALVATYAAVVTGLDHVAATRFDAVLADHRRHLDALAAVASAAVAGWTPIAGRPARPVPTDLAGLERDASAAMLALVPTANGDLAGLLASIAASEASHAQVVGVLRHAVGQ